MHKILRRPFIFHPLSDEQPSLLEKSSWILVTIWGSLVAFTTFAEVYAR